MTMFLMIFRRFLTTFQRFPKIFQNCSEGQTNASEHFPNISEHFPKITDDRQRLPKMTEEGLTIFQSYINKFKCSYQEKCYQKGMISSQCER